MRPTWNTWEGGVGAEGAELPRRPSTDDLGGDDKLDNNDAPPDDVEHFTAQGWNQLVKQVAALVRVAASCKIEVRYDAGTPFVSRCSAPSANVTKATFTVFENSTGDVSITWPADTFPPAVISPHGLTLLSSASAVVDGHVEEITNGIRVRTRSGGSAAEVPFTICLN